MILHSSCPIQVASLWIQCPVAGLTFKSGFWQHMQHVLIWEREGFLRRLQKRNQLQVVCVSRGREKQGFLPFVVNPNSAHKCTPIHRLCFVGAANAISVCVQSLFDQFFLRCSIQSFQVLEIGPNSTGLSFVNNAVVSHVLIALTW